MNSRSSACFRDINRTNCGCDRGGAATRPSAPERRTTLGAPPLVTKERGFVQQISHSCENDPLSSGAYVAGMTPRLARLTCHTCHVGQITPTESTHLASK